MKTKKIISLILAVCMVASVISISVVASSAAEAKDSLTDVSADYKEAKAKVAAEIKDRKAELSADATEAAGVGATEASTEPTEPTEPVNKKDTDLATTGDESNSTGKLIPISTLKLCPFKEYSIIYDAIDKHDPDYDYTPAEVIATQDANGGTNYVFLCSFYYSPEKQERDTKGMSASQKEKYNKYDDGWWEIDTVYVDSQGTITLKNRAKIDINNIATTDKPNTSWNIVDKSSGTEILSGDKAIYDYSDIKLGIIDELGYEDVSSLLFPTEDGYTMRYLCYGTKDSKTDIYVVDVYKDFHTGDAKVSDVKLFDLNSYAMLVPVEKNGGSENRTSGGSATSEKSSSEKSKTSASGTSPNTGTPNVVLFVMMIALVAFLGVCVSVKQITKKHD